MGWSERNLFRSADGGITWTNLGLGSEGLAAITMIKFDPINPNITYVGTTEMGLFKTTDNGLNWFSINNGLISLTPPLLGSVGKLCMKPDSTNILYLSQGGKLFKSTNSGDFWFSIDSSLQLIDSGIGAGDILISTINKNRIYLSRGMFWNMGRFYSGGLYFTEDEGLSWAKIKTHSIGEMIPDPHNKNKIYLNCTDGILIFYDTLTTNADDPKLLPTEYGLSQNYPNPFNSETVIKYKIPAKSKIKVLIYDILGRLVKTYFAEHAQPGEYQIKWNGKNEKGGDLSSGVYFYRLEAENFVTSKKMLLLR